MPTALYSGERYTDDEREYLRENHAVMTRAELARELGRSKTSVALQLMRMGLRKRATLAGCGAELRCLHAAGMRDAQIARQMLICRRTVGMWRKALELPANVTRAECGRLGKQGLRRKARGMGCATWAEHLADRRRLACARQWPGCWTASQVAVCRHLSLPGGPQSRGQIAASLGKRGDAVSRSLAQLDGAGVVRREPGGWALVPLLERQEGRHHTRQGG